MSRSRATRFALILLPLAFACPVRGQSPFPVTVNAVAFSADGKTVFTAGADGTLRFWDAASNKELLSLPAHARGVFGLALSPDGKVLATSGGDHVVRLWDVAKCMEPQVLTAFQKDKERLDKLLTDLDDDEFELRNKARVELLKIGAVAAPVLNRAAATSPSPEVRHQSRLLLGKLLNPDEEVRQLWGEVDKAKVRHTLTGHKNPVLAVAFSPDGKMLATGDFNDIFLWDAATGKKERTLLPRGGGITSLAFSPDGQTLASGSTLNFPSLPNNMQAGAVLLWDPATGKELRLLGHSGSVVSFAPGKMLAVTGFTWPNPQPGRQIATDGSRAAFVDQASGKPRRQFDDIASTLALSPDGQLLATGWGRFLVGMPPYLTPGAPRLRVWETATGKAVLDFSEQGRVTALAFSPDGMRLAAGREDGSLHVLSLAPKEWDAAKAKNLEAKDLDRLWQDLAQPEAAKGNEALWTLATAGDKAVDLLKRNVRPAPAVDERVRKLIADLDHEEFDMREKAMRELGNLGAEVEKDLEKALMDVPSLEMRRRLETLLEAIRKFELTSEQVRGVRVVRILERIGSKDAQELLKALAKGSPRALLTQDARAALDRMQKQQQVAP
jgi:WD40 repeat protein